MYEIIPAFFLLNEREAKRKVFFNIDDRTITTLRKICFKTHELIAATKKRKLWITTIDYILAINKRFFYLVVLSSSVGRLE